MCIYIYIYIYACVCAKYLQLSPTLCNPMDCSPPGSTLHGILNWSELPCLPPGDLPDPGIESMSPASSAFQADSLPLTHQGSPHIYIQAPLLLVFHINTDFTDQLCNSGFLCM